MWKFYNLAATQNLREIKFWCIQKVKNVNFGIFGDSEFAC